jgi:carbamoyltransferase
MLLVESVKNADPVESLPDAASERLDQLHAGRSPLPAITHVDNSARIQTVHRETNPRFHALLSRFKERTGCPVLVNTSFNVRGEPIVCTPDDAYKCFMNSELDLLVIENCLIRKDQQAEELAERYRMSFPSD